MKPFQFSEPNNIYFICEIGSNHLQSIYRIKQLIKQAAWAGCDAIKFQFFKANRLYHSSMPDAIAVNKKRELPYRLLIEACKIAHAHDISIGCSIFHIEDVERIASICDFIKISSYDCMRKDLIDECRKYDNPLFISTGMCDPQEIISIGENANPRQSDGFFHCISQYPVNIKNVFLPSANNILFYNWEKCKYKGYSDHTAKPAVIYAALARGYNMFECHFDLSDNKGAESKHGHCWEPALLKETIQTAKEMHKIDKSNITIPRIDRKEFIYRADSEDGMRPLKGFR